MSGMCKTLSIMYRIRCGKATKKDDRHANIVILNMMLISASG